MAEQSAQAVNSQAIDDQANASTNGTADNGAAGDDGSMEDILQSIRRFIADGGEEASANGENMNNTHDNNSAENGGDLSASDILELTEVVDDEGNVSSLAEEKSAEKSAEKATNGQDVLASIDSALSAEEKTTEQSAEDTPIPQAEVADIMETAEATIAASEPEAVAPTPENTASAAPAPSTEDALLSDETLAASQAALHKLQQPAPTTTTPSSAPSPVFRSGNTVEDLVLESLKPMLKEWLDTHLTPIVERKVEQEIRRLQGK